MEIKAAVQAYRSHIAEHHRRIFEVFVNFIATAEGEPGDWEDESIEEVRINSLAALFGEEIKKYITVPGDVLTRYDELVPIFGLDGTGMATSQSLFDDEYIHERDSYFSLLEQALKKKCLEEVRETITVPEEFRILAEYVFQLTGPGPEDYKTHQAMFWTGTTTSAEAIDAIVKTPDEENFSFNRDWECAVFWEPGEGWRYAFYVVYCRRIPQPGTEPEPWAWRYVVSSMYEKLTVFDTIPEFLEMYCRYGEAEIPDVSELDADDILTGMWVNYGFI
ncbi:uncharacterized protein CTRU02_204355 [Colletotrichum truncatum]|uniref:Uncharacterized protein n=1 Tax=Colletotrichum truncatum TaxID=5467 RepID=A0ACC3ZBV0_COLTU